MKCELCGKEHDGSYGSGRFCSRHCRSVYAGKISVEKKRENGTLEISMARARSCIEQNKKPIVNLQPGGKCRFCGEHCKNRNSLINHERLCKENPNRASINLGYYHRCGHQAWNKGLTKENDARVAKRADTLKRRYASGEIVNHMRGKKHTNEEKKKISETMKRKIANGEIEAPYKRNHYSKGPSYPEQFFIEVFSNAGISVAYNFQVGLYQLDFANPATKKYVEIDGDQHYLDERIVKHDIERTENLKNQGWQLIKRVKWSDFQKMSQSEKHKLCVQLVKELS